MGPIAVPGMYEFLPRRVFTFRDVQLVGRTKMTVVLCGPDLVHHGGMSSFFLCTNDHTRVDPISMCTEMATVVS